MAHYFDVISCGIKQIHAQFSLCNILIELHDSTLNRTHHGGFQRQLLFLIALWVMTAPLEGTQYITLLSLDSTISWFS